MLTSKFNVRRPWGKGGGGAQPPDEGNVCCRVDRFQKVKMDTNKDEILLKTEEEALRSDMGVGQKRYIPFRDRLSHLRCLIDM